MMNIKTNNFMTDKAYKITDIPGVLTIVNYDKKELEKTIDTTVIKFIPSSFERPIDIMYSNTLKIVLDNSFDLVEDDCNIIFIDHHLTETAYNKSYSSNSLLMYKNYKKIKAVLEKIVNKNIKIKVYYHFDLDGIASAFMLKLLLSEIFKNIEVCEDVKRFIMILGEYGDISNNKTNWISEWDSEIMNYMEGSKDIDNLCKKFNNFTTGITRITKIIRPYVYAKAVENDILSFKIIDEFSKRLGGNPEMYTSMINKFLDGVNNLNSTSIAGFINFFNCICSDFDFSTLKAIFEEEKNVLVEQLVYPTHNNSIFRVHCKFINDINEDIYELFFINTPMDLGRSLVWSYDKKLEFYKPDPYDNDYRFYNHHYRGGIAKIREGCINKACYNNFLNKLILDSKNTNSAFEIGQYYGGGGHGNLRKDMDENGSMAIGSATVDVDVLMENIKIIDIS